MTKVQKKNQLERQIKEDTADLLAKLKVEATIEVKKETAPDGEHYKVDIQTPETGLLIGFHGETLNSLQLLLGVILYKKLGVWVHVILDVGGYRKGREENIKEMVGRIVTEVDSTKQPVTLPYLSPLERRIVHMMVTDNKSVVSESAGEGKDRRVTIKPR